MLSRFRYVFGAVFFLLVASCSGGGCGGCGGCAGMTPLPGGFPADKAVENAASVRVSRPGLDFVEKNLPGIVAKAIKTPDGTFTVQIPETSFAVDDAFLKVDVDGTFCPGGPDPKANPPRCTAVIDIAKIEFQVDAVKPNVVVVRGTVPLKLDDTPVKITTPGSFTVHVGYGANSSCDGETPHVDVKQLPVKISVPIVAETTAPRTGYSRVDVDNAVIDLGAVNSDDVRICGSCGGLGICNSILNWGFIKDRIVDGIKSGLSSQFKNLLRDQLCTKPNPSLNPACPTETSPDENEKYCVYDSDKEKCVPLLLGTAAHVDLGGFLRNISPGTAGALDFGLGAFGPMIPAPNVDANEQGDTPNGITLGMVGGAVPQPPSKCVPQKTVLAPSGIPIPDEIAPSAADPTTAPHVGVALAGRFLDYTLGTVYNSGLLCLGVSTAQLDLLKSGLLAFLIPSIKNLTFEQADAAAAIVTRPQEPPVVKIGGGTDPTKDPLLTITIPKLSLDFYIWSFDRFVRIFTYTGDLTVPVSLQTGKGPNNPQGGIIPAIGEMKVANGKVTNSDTLLFDDPNLVAGAVSAVFGTVSKQLLGTGFSPINFSSALASLGLDLEINTIKKLTKGSDDFVGIFGTMSKAASAATVEADTGAKLVGKRVWNDQMSASTYDREKLPELEVELSSTLDDGVRAIEYSWWIDGGTRSSWSREKHLVVKDDQLFFQGRHVLHVTSRIAGDAATEDTTPADVPYVIDALAPFVKIERDGTSATVKTWDLVTDRDALVARYRLDDGAFGEWRPVRDLEHLSTGSAESVEVEVKDEEGNVGTVRQALRGRGDPTLSPAGCGCSTPGTKTVPPTLALALGALGLALLVLRRRGVGRATARRMIARSGMAVGTIAVVAATSQGCACGDATAPETGCGADCNQACQTGLPKGQPGAYLSVAKSKDGSIWAAGYNDSLLNEADAFLWGDLVVGRYDLGKEEVAWETVDGIPTRSGGTCPAYEPYGWRKGETDAGDNVGRWTSIQLSTKDEPMVSYYDDTNKRLKFAINDGGWKVSVLKEQPGADIGKYSKMVLVAGKPVIAYMHAEPGTAGRTRTKISVARATSESPHGAADFTIEDVAVDEDGPCRADACDDGYACLKDTSTCTKQVSGCTPGCSDTQACVTKDNKATCLAKASAITTYPRGLGAYISMASGPEGLGLIAYDGYHGNLMGFIDRGTAPWERVLLDGETGSRADKSAIDTGDVGVAASLAIDESGTWHVSYVNGLDETLRYLTVSKGKPGKSEIVDDGTQVDGKPFPDGKHVVGDDSSIRVEGDVITIYYADSSSLGLRRATGTAAPGKTHRWDLATVEQEGKWVAFPQCVPGDDKVAVWWRKTLPETKSVEGNVIVLSP